ncbi:unnamed protein product [Pedinophyceae sp. YPF-701]|nr:unnamed protein product [Pedinophyceae sp. YPF-701]
MSAAASTFTGAALNVRQKAGARRAATRQVVVAAAPSYVPDMGKRNTMNLLLAGAASLPIGALAVPFALYLAPPGSGGGGGAQPAKDALGNSIKSKSWLKDHLAGDHSLAQGLKGDPTYIIVNADGKIEDFGVNAVCTHLGCVVPWNSAENKFKCPCHGSQYNFQGKVVRGPAPLSLALAHLEIDDGDNVLFSPWTETDFRTGQEPWW